MGDPRFRLLLTLAIVGCSEAPQAQSPAGPEDAGLLQPAPTPPEDAGLENSDAGASPEPPKLATDYNPSWVGGPCHTDADCSYDGGFCLTEAQGYPGGQCSLACEQYCPDHPELDADPRYTITFCTEGATGGQCAARCDQTRTESGCRPGYVCQSERRNNASFVTRACVPETGVPGRTEPANDIGAACSTDADCGYNTCIQGGQPGGYCSKHGCETLDCPNSSACFEFGFELHTCLQQCVRDEDCRQDEGYICDHDNVCWYYPPERPDCVLEGAAQDCVDDVSAVSSRTFVVAQKSLRRLSLCEGSTLVHTACMGLGFSPEGDKEVQGDGRTPEGQFYIPRVLPNSRYHKAFLLSYPDTDDADRGLEAGRITPAEHAAIVQAQTDRTEPPQFTGLGGLIEIHGEGGSDDWTWGCLALDNSDVDVLWSHLEVGDIIWVKP